MMLKNRNEAIGGGGAVRLASKHAVRHNGSVAMEARSGVGAQAQDAPRLREVLGVVPVLRARQKSSYGVEREPRSELAEWEVERHSRKELFSVATGTRAAQRADRSERTKEREATS